MGKKKRLKTEDWTMKFSLVYYIHELSQINWGWNYTNFGYILNSIFLFQLSKTFFKKTVFLNWNFQWIVLLNSTNE